MEYNIEYLPEKGIVFIKMKGRLNFQIVEQFSKEAIKIARQNQSSKFIIDHTKSKIREGSFQIYAAGDELQQFGFQNTDKIAILISDLDDISDSYESININSRWSDIKYFDGSDINKAFSWLDK
ncbi:MAG TPA: hypothetical protein ENN33_08055 [Ignavibacteria bacterium]|nr:hypothetical protein [Ignavibacteria bacterium]